MQFGELKLNLWTSIGLQKINVSWIDLKILPQLEESTNFPTSFIGFKHQMQKLR